MLSKIFRNQCSYRLFLTLILLLIFAGDLYIGLRIYKKSPKTDILLQKEEISKQEIQKEAQNIAKNCESEKYPEQCFAQEFKKLTEKTTTAYSKEVLFALQEIAPQSRGCHLIAHYISGVEARRNPENWLGLLSQQDANTCTGGFIHGILEVHAGTDPNFKLTASQFPIICGQLPAQGDARRSCFHNLGHILLVDELNSIPKAVSTCNEIAMPLAKNECLSGVFMENLTRLNIRNHGLGETIPWDRKRAAEIEILCKEYSGLAAQACWKEISYVYAAANNTEPSKVFADCNKAPTEKARTSCYIYGVGNMVAFTTFDPARLNEVCLVYDETNPLFKTCMNQMIGSMIASSAKYNDRVTSLCTNAPLWYREECFKQIGLHLKRNEYSIEKREVFCSEVAIEYKLLCIGS